MSGVRVRMGATLDTETWPSPEARTLPSPNGEDTAGTPDKAEPLRVGINGSGDGMGSADSWTGTDTSVELLALTDNGEFVSRSSFS